MNGGFTSPALLELQNSNLTRSPAQYFSNNSSLPNIFAALGTIGAMFGGIVAWPVSDHFGRQTALVVGGIPFLCGWVLIANAPLITQSKPGFLVMLFTGRVLAGFSTGWSIFCTSVYIAEISSPKWKGFFGNCNQLFVTIGILLTYFFGINFGNFTFSYSHVALIAAGLVALFEILMLTTYETPRWLLSQDMDFVGIRVLRILRGNQFNIISKEIDSIKAKLRHTYSTKDQLLEFRKRSVLQPFVLVVLMMFFQQFSGINAAIFYASQIFTDAGFSNEKANLISFGTVGCVQVLSTFISVMLVDYLGRRVLLVASSIGMVTSSILLGVYFRIFKHTCKGCLEHPGCPSHIEYLAIVGIIVFISSFSIGWGPIPWSSMSELLPSRVRTLGGSIATLVNWGSATVVLYVFPIFVNQVGGDITWWCFSAIMVLSVFFVVFFVPEARGRSLEEIQQHFESGSIIVRPFRSKESNPVELEETTNSAATTLSKPSVNSSIIVDREKY